MDAVGLPWDLGPRFAVRYCGDKQESGLVAVHSPSRLYPWHPRLRAKFVRSKQFPSQNDIIEGQTVGAALGFEGVETMSGPIQSFTHAPHVTLLHPSVLGRVRCEES